MVSDPSQTPPAGPAPGPSPEVSVVVPVFNESGAAPDLAREIAADLVVIGPEASVEAGLADALAWVSQWGEGGDELAALLARADAALYRAKAAGRNRVEGESPPGAPRVELVR